MNNKKTKENSYQNEPLVRDILLAEQLYNSAIDRFRGSNNETECRYLDEARMYMGIVVEAFKNAERFSK